MMPPAEADRLYLRSDFPVQARHHIIGRAAVEHVNVSRLLYKSVTVVQPALMQPQASYFEFL